jgi:ferredoxin-NADP reductase
VSLLYTRIAPDEFPRPPGRLVPDDLAGAGSEPSRAPLCFVCGHTSFVEAAADVMVGLGHQPDRIRTERFGPTGG